MSQLTTMSQNLFKKIYIKFTFKEVKSMSDKDIIKMDTDIHLTDKNGEPIQVTTPQPEYIAEAFNFKPKMSSSKKSGDDE